MKKQRESSIRWLQKNVAGSFWEWTHERLCEINLEHRQALIWINRSMGLKDSKSFRKILSYAGSIRVPDDFPDKLVTWKDEKLKERQLEPGNGVYRKAFRAAWPRVLPDITNNETVGDMLEAFLALAWMYRCKGVKLPVLCDDFVEMLERLVYAEFCLAEWGM